MSKLVALVPMKGNSERVPNKNLKDFNGKPLFYWIINSLYESNVVDEVVINTDSDEISKVARSLFSNVVIHKRPLEICGDFVSMNKVLENDLSYYSSNEIFYKLIQQIHCSLLRRLLQPLKNIKKEKLNMIACFLFWHIMEGFMTILRNQ